MIWQRKHLCLDMFFPFRSFDFGYNLLPSHFFPFFASHMPFFLHLYPLCNQHQASTQGPSLPDSMYSILLEGPPLMAFRGIFPFFKLSYPFLYPLFPPLPSLLRPWIVPSVFKREAKDFPQSFNLGLSQSGITRSCSRLPNQAS